MVPLVEVLVTITLFWLSRAVKSKLAKVSGLTVVATEADTGEIQPLSLVTVPVTETALRTVIVRDVAPLLQA